MKETDKDFWAGSGKKFLAGNPRKKSREIVP